MTRLLLDTHVVLWWAANSRRLRPDARRGIALAEQVFVSAVSAWEVAIKTAIGRLRLRDPFAAIVDRNGFDPLPIVFRHAERLASLPPHHRDPFDRMLVAQALAEGLTIVTHDRAFVDYEIATLWT